MSPLDGDKCLASRTGHFIPGERGDQLVAGRVRLAARLCQFVELLNPLALELDI